jgi:uncharacterized protein (TIGR02246 family)
MPHSSSSESPEATALAFVDAINAGDLDALVELMTEDHAFIDDDGNEQRGRDTMRWAWRSYFESFPEYQIHTERVVTLGNTVVLIGRTTGSHIAPEVEALETVIWAALVDGGRVREWHILYTDNEKAQTLLAAADALAEQGDQQE